MNEHNGQDWFGPVSRNEPVKICRRVLPGNANEVKLDWLGSVSTIARGGLVLLNWLNVLVLVAFIQIPDF